MIRKLIFSIVVAVIVVLLGVLIVVRGVRTYNEYQFDVPPTIFWGQHRYVFEGLHDTFPDAQMIGTISSVCKSSRSPTEHGQANFPAIGSVIYQHADGLTVFYNNGWMYFTAR